MSKGQASKGSFKAKNIFLTNWPLQFLHMDLFGPSTTVSIGGNFYDLIVVDDYSATPKKRCVCCLSKTSQGYL